MRLEFVITRLPRFDWDWFGPFNTNEFGVFGWVFVWCRTHFIMVVRRRFMGVPLFVGTLLFMGTSLCVGASLFMGVSLFVAEQARTTHIF